jgi:hypothetical protein
MAAASTDVCTVAAFKGYGDNLYKILASAARPH